MPIREFKPLPPDHPIFHGGVGFVFPRDLPKPVDERDESEHEHEDDE
jgi:hypothetical protein